MWSAAVLAWPVGKPPPPKLAIILPTNKKRRVLGGGPEATSDNFSDRLPLLYVLAHTPNPSTPNPSEPNCPEPNPPSQTEGDNDDEDAIASLVAEIEAAHLIEHRSKTACENKREYHHLAPDPNPPPKSALPQSPNPNLPATRASRRKRGLDVNVADSGSQCDNDTNHQGKQPTRNGGAGERSTDGWRTLPANEANAVRLLESASVLSGATEFENFARARMANIEIVSTDGSQMRLRAKPDPESDPESDLLPGDTPLADVLYKLVSEFGATINHQTFAAARARVMKTSDDVVVIDAPQLPWWEIIPELLIELPPKRGIVPAVAEGLRPALEDGDYYDDYKDEDQEEFSDDDSIDYANSDSDAEQQEFRFLGTVLSSSSGGEGG